MQPWRRTDWTIDDWVDHACVISRRRHGAPRTEAGKRHVSVFPHAAVPVEIDRATLERLREFILNDRTQMFSRPMRGFREGHWTTQVLVDIHNQLAKLDQITGRNSQG